MRLSGRIGKLEPQLARQMYTAAKQYKNVIDLTLGDPDMPTPEFIVRAACESLEAGNTHYTANKGISDLLRAVSDDIYDRLGICYDPECEIIITPGAMGALYLASVCLVNPGDEALLLAPHWPNYTNMILMCDGIPIDVDCYSVQSDLIIDNLRAQCTDKTRLLVMNSPCNPTGRTLESETLDMIAALAEEKNLIVFSDEVYASILFSGKKHDSILKRDGMRNRTVLIDSFSKRFAMTGWRVGFAAAPAELIAKMTEMQEHTSACVAPFAQHAAVAGLREGRMSEREIMRTFENRCGYVKKRLDGIGKIACRETEGTFYLFVDIRKTGLNSEEFVGKLLKEEQVAVVPGNAFGKYGEGYIRIACTQQEKILAQACDRLERFVIRM